MATRPRSRPGSGSGRSGHSSGWRSRPRTPSFAAADDGRRGRGCRHRSRTAPTRSGTAARARATRSRDAPRVAHAQPDRRPGTRRDVAATSLAWYDELRLPGALVAGLHDTGFGEGDAWAITDDVRVLLALPRPSAIRGSARVVASAAARGVAGAGDVAGRDRAQHLGGRRVPRPRPAPGRPVVGRPPRHDRRAGRSDRGGQRACRGPSRGRGRGGRLSRRSAARGARRRGAEGRGGEGRSQGRCGRSDPPRRARRRANPASRAYPRRIRRRSDVGGVPWASTDSRCGR